MHRCQVCGDRGDEAHRVECLRAALERVYREGQRDAARLITAAIRRQLARHNRVVSAVRILLAVDAIGAGKRSQVRRGRQRQARSLAGRSRWRLEHACCIHPCRCCARCKGTGLDPGA